MRRMDPESVDLVVTSPPYDGLRTYKGFSFPFKDIARGMARILKPGGVIVWVVGDQVVDGSETGSSFRQALYFMDICGLNLHDTMIYQRSASYPANDKSNRYSQAFEFMFVISKGKPKTTNLFKDKKNAWGGTGNFGTNSERKGDGELKKRKKYIIQDFGIRDNIWKYATGKGYSSEDAIASLHPAIFPEKLAGEHILSWSNEGDLVYDPFGGSGTVGKVSHLLKRDWILSEMSADYVTNIINPRLKVALQKNLLF